MKKLLLATILLFAASPVWGETYYVSKAGDDGRACSTTDSDMTNRLTIFGGIACLDPGSSLFVHVGTYAEGISLNNFNASASVRTVIAAYPGETVIVQPPVGSGGGGVIGARIMPNVSYVTLQNFTFDCRHVAGDTCVAINSSTVHDITIQGNIIGNCDLDNAPFPGTASQNRSGITGGGPGTQILNNRIHHCNYGIYGSQGIIEGNEVDNNWGPGIHRNCDGCFTGNTIMRGNKVHDNGQSGFQAVNAGVGNGIEIYSGDGDSYVYNNAIYDNWDSGIYANFGSSTGNGRNFFYNNTIVHNRNTSTDYLAAGIALNTESVPTTVRGNLICENSGSAINNQGGSNTIDSNLTPGTCPDFMDETARDLRLASTAATAIDDGPTITEVTSDILGIARPQDGDGVGGAAYDYGAYEFFDGGGGGGPNEPGETSIFTDSFTTGATQLLTAYDPTNWLDTKVSGTDGVKVDAGTDRVYGNPDLGEASGSTGWSVVAKGTYSANQYATLNIPVRPTTSGNLIGVTARASNDSGAARDHYECFVNGSDQKVYLNRRVDDIPVYLGNSTNTFTQGNNLKIYALGNQISCKENTTTIVGPITDTILAGGKPGLMGGGNVASILAAGDNADLGNLDPPVDPPTGTIIITFPIAGSRYQRPNEQVIGIAWTTSQEITGNLRLCFSLVGSSGPWRTIASTVAYNASPYSWDASIPASSTLYIRVEQGGTVCGTGTVFATIGPIRMSGRYQGASS